MFSKYLILIGRTFIVAFLVVNFFNIIPFDFSNNAWLTQVSMLFVDTGSLLLLGIVCLKICNILQTKKLLINQSKDVSSVMEHPIINQNTGIDFLNKFSKYFMIFFIILGISQAYIFINGLNYINYDYSYTFQQIDEKYTKQKKKMETESENIQDLNDSINNLENKKSKYLQELDRNVSKARFLLFRNNIKVSIMSLIWAYGLFKLSKLNHDVNKNQ